MTAIKLTIIGAGSIVFSLDLVKNVCLTEGLKGSTVHFMDINEERLDVVFKLAQRYAQDLGSDLKFQRTLDRTEALLDADFVVNTATITHNEYFMKRRREMVDKMGYFYGNVNMPEYHNLQLMLDVAKDVEKISPKAWILQAGNPVFDGTTLMGRETNVKVVGLCHGHYGYARIARQLGLDPDKVTWQAPGLNHNIWMTKFYYDGQDAYPLLNKWIDENIEQYWAENKDKGIPAQLSPAAVHMYKMYGLFPIGDTARSGGWWYHTDLETRTRWYGHGGGGDTPEGRDAILKDKEDKYDQMKAAAYDPKARPVELFGAEKTREQHIPIIDALVNDHEYRAQVNVLNHGALPGLPEDVAVEVPAIVNQMGIQPIRVEPLPRKVMLECIYPDWLDMERTLEALRLGDKSMLLYGVLNSHATRDYDQAVKVMESLIDIQPNEPMAYIEDIHDHYHWPKNWE
jgi:alpha-galactosidase